MVRVESHCHVRGTNARESVMMVAALRDPRSASNLAKHFAILVDTFVVCLVMLQKIAQKLIVR